MRWRLSQCLEIKGHWHQILTCFLYRVHHREFCYGNILVIVSETQAPHVITGSTARPGHKSAHQAVIGNVTPWGRRTDECKESDGEEISATVTMFSLRKVAGVKTCHSPTTTTGFGTIFTFERFLPWWLLCVLAYGRIVRGLRP